jgi:hypothetical protein
MRRTVGAWLAKSPLLTRWRALRPQQRRPLWAVVLLGLALAFPFVDRNPATLLLDSGVLGSNVVRGVQCLFKAFEK